MMIIYRIKIAYILCIALCFTNEILAGSDLPDSGKLNKIDSFIAASMARGNYPGISVAIVKEKKTLLLKGYGYSNLEKKELVTPATLFELGSNSKAFTALGLLVLEREGVIDLDYPVTKIIPWFKVTYDNAEQIVTLKHLLYHTSGISYMALKSIPPDTTVTALETAVRKIIEYPLLSKPGSEFSYSTCNYDIIGYILEIVSGRTYENFMEDYVLKPMGLNSTYLDREACIARQEIAKGYHLSFSGNKEQHAPEYRGNLPAGYIISNGYDMAQWLKINLGKVETAGFDPYIIRASHEPDRSVDSTLVFPYSSTFQYAAGWLVFNGTKRISHGGGNPNFASYIALYPDEELGIAVLGNRNSSYPYGICQGIYDILKDADPSPIPTDILLVSNNVLIGIFCIGLLIIVWTLWKLLKILSDIRGEKRQYCRANTGKGILWLVILTITSGLFLYYLPVAIYFGFPWSLIKVWAPASILPALVTLFIGLAFQYIVLYVKKVFPKAPPYNEAVNISNANQHRNKQIVS